MRLQAKGVTFVYFFSFAKFRPRYRQQLSVGGESLSGRVVIIKWTWGYIGKTQKIYAAVLIVSDSNTNAEAIRMLILMLNRDTEQLSIYTKGTS